MAREQKIYFDEQAKISDIILNHEERLIQLEVHRKRNKITDVMLMFAACFAGMSVGEIIGRLIFGS